MDVAVHPLLSLLRWDDVLELCDPNSLSAIDVDHDVDAMHGFEDSILDLSNSQC